jgi:tRNA(Ile)-lysidine synthase TilS/MesJ
LDVRGMELKETGENYMTRNFILCTTAEYYQNHQIKYKKGETCTRIGEIRNMYKFFLLKILKGRYHSEDLGVDGKIILK